jgi:hypothetical protein
MEQASSDRLLAIEAQLKKLSRQQAYLLNSSNEPSTQPPYGPPPSNATPTSQPPASTTSSESEVVIDTNRVMAARQYRTRFMQHAIPQTREEPVSSQPGTF